MIPCAQSIPLTPVQLDSRSSAGSPRSSGDRHLIETRAETHSPSPTPDSPSSKPTSFLTSTAGTPSLRPAPMPLSNQDTSSQRPGRRRRQAENKSPSSKDELVTDI
eukprot:CAMPEP_0184498152 /NCGR_PEP_ID=MMETSP0113_2-20130426/38243_1 /TAXON_ID=91329 /ORGANISM="Norrisiella sphaerica, Strain BC52" /LENGTH=105 /DNA_ID=CAMNT_0026885543 /DNA_START=154 /DNA_END=471 /DNA_ORIENTATION=-